MTGSARVALVTCPDSKVGDAVVSRLRADGMEVVTATPAAQRYDGAAAADGWDRVVGELVAAHGRLDVLVSVPDEDAVASAEALSDATLRRAVNLLATPAFRQGRAAFAQMRRQASGSIVFVAGTCALRGDRQSPARSTALAAIPVIGQLLAAEGRGHGVAAFSVCPDWARLSEEGAVTPAGIAGIVAWLGSGAATAASGATVTVDAARTVAVGEATTRVTSTPGGN